MQIYDFVKEKLMKKLFLVFGILEFSFVYAAPLDEIFKDVELSGVIRCRYEKRSIKEFDKKTQRYQNKISTEITIK